MTQPGFLFVSSAASDVGTVRSLNEDSLLDRPDLGLWIVADGMGGHDAGDYASFLICDVLRRMEPPSSAAGFLGDVRAGLDRVNQDLRQQAAVAGEDTIIASTVVALLTFGQHFAVLWVGDSRAYLWRGGALRQLSHDHSHVQELVDAGLLTQAEAEVHPQANIVTRAVGAHEYLAPDVVQGRILPDDVFVLCTDGLTRAIGEDVMTATLAAEPVEQVAAALVARALENAARDNVTVVAVGCRAGGAAVAVDGGSDAAPEEPEETTVKRHATAERDPDASV
jgi:serine/threonine protein phosphatase PrpC